MVNSFKRQIRGVCIPTITPFFENGQINLYALNKHLKWLKREGVNGIVVGGTTGEGHVLTAAEKKRLIDTAVLFRKKDPKFIIISGTGSRTLNVAAGIASYAKKKGCDAILALPPKTNDQEKIDQFYTALSRRVPNIPIFAYNIPSLTNVSIHPHTAAKLFKTKSIVGIKDSSQDPALILEWKKVEPGLTLIIGEDRLIHYGASNANADAVVAGTGNIAPKEVIDSFNLKGKKGEEAQKKLNTIIDLLLSEGSFGGALKLYMQAKGQIHSDQRRTSGRLTGAARARFLRALEETQ